MTLPPNAATAEAAATAIDTPAALGDAVRLARRQLSLTQPQLALAAGVGVRFIVDLEAGKPTLRLENILRVLHALGGSLAVNGLPTPSEGG
jgi:y4mF family transcriptional regulator